MSPRSRNEAPPSSSQEIRPHVPTAEVLVQSSTVQGVAEKEEEKVKYMDYIGQPSEHRSLVRFRWSKRNKGGKVMLQKLFYVDKRA